MIALGADHGGFDLKESIKEHLLEQGIEVKDFGTHGKDSVHYPMIAKDVCGAVAGGECRLGILCCGTGVGMSIAANKIKGIRAACCSDIFSARLTRQHNDANILCLGERVLGPGLADMLVDGFLAAEFEGGRHQTRVELICELEKQGG